MRVLQWTDSHGDVASQAATAKLWNDSSGIDLLVHTGDVLNDVFENPLPATWDTCFTVGNHDAILRAGAVASGYQWNVQPTQQQKFQKFYASNPARSQMTFGPTADATWWTHRFEKDNVLLVGLDYTVINQAYNDEKAWLQTVIDQCVADGTKIIVATHQMPMGCVELDCNFDNPRFVRSYGRMSSLGSAQWYPFMQESAYMIWKACDWYGLKCLFWMMGHTHADMMFISPTKVPFPMVTLTSTLIYGAVDSNTYSNLVRVNDASDVRCPSCNLYDYDPTRNTLQIYRLGGGRSIGGKRRNMLIWDYTNNTFMTNSFTRYPFEVLGYTR